MGQQDSQPKYQTVQIHQPLNNHPQIKPSQLVQHQGILKLRITPFKNCTQIDYGNQTLFIENINTTLEEILQPRLFTNKLFPEEDVVKLIESVVYSLAYLQENNICYPNINTNHIFYHDHNFKILPPQVISESIYQLALKPSTEFILLSPEMIIALRCQQPDVIDQDIIHKSNVFIFGMILMEVTTLLPASQCYDHQNYDILDDIITQRLSMIEEHYGEKIARIIGNMIDYDYTERMDLKQLAIWINRQLNEVRHEVIEQSDREKNKKVSNLVKSRFVNSKVDKVEPELNRLNPSRTNQVYMNYEDIYMSSDKIARNQSQKNKIYLKQSYMRQLKDSYHQDKIAKHKNQLVKQVKQHYDYLHPTFKKSYDKPLLENSKQLNDKNTYKYFPSLDQLDQQSSKNQKNNLKMHQENPLKDYNRQYQKSNSNSDHSINRIKEQIEKSRKLIQQFQKSQGIGNNSKYN